MEKAEAKEICNAIEKIGEMRQQLRKLPLNTRGSKEDAQLNLNALKVSGELAEIQNELLKRIGG